MLLDLLGAEAKLVEADHVIPDPVLPNIAIGHAEGAIEAVHPSEEGKA